ncbi:hypothetical protein CKAN_01478600 [Cinnamomum micranthum f. kanehirae]|uniref:Uncharacterized protein n=1 Tax=Cinnamomum micranthum f. kanehirae TaxID=337451 RepID=A0A443P562_9MAGN|nr:hypothetical protein CKAN_01478600 [Cinnamomum micranthum f. kanehirae]
MSLGSPCVGPFALWPFPLLACEESNVHTLSAGRGEPHRSFHSFHSCRVWEKSSAQDPRVYLPPVSREWKEWNH